jgi:hypothetical protein
VSLLFLPVCWDPSKPRISYVPRKSDKRTEPVIMARRRIDALTQLNDKVMVCHSTQGFFAAVNSGIHGVRTITEFNGYDLQQVFDEGDFRAPYRNIHLPSCGFFQIDDVFWGFVSRGMPNDHIPEACKALGYRPITEKQMMDVAFSRYFSIAGQEAGLALWSGLGGYIYPTKAVLAREKFGAPLKITWKGPFKPGYEDICKEYQGEKEDKNEDSIPKKNLKTKLKCVGYKKDIRKMPEENPIPSHTVSAGKNVRRPPGSAWALLSTAVQQEPLPDFNWDIQNDEADLRNRARRYSDALMARRARLETKMKRINPLWDPNDSDDSIDWQVDIILPVGVRPRKRLRRDPDYNGPKSPRNCPFIFPYSSSDDDDDGGIDPTGESRKRRRVRRAKNLTTSQDMNRDVGILSTVIANKDFAVNARMVPPDRATDTVTEEAEPAPPAEGASQREQEPEPQPTQSKSPRTKDPFKDKAPPKDKSPPPDSKPSAAGPSAARQDSGASWQGGTKEYPLPKDNSKDEDGNEGPKNKKKAVPKYPKEASREKAPDKDDSDDPDEGKLVKKDSPKPPKKVTKLPPSKKSAEEVKSPSAGWDEDKEQPSKKSKAASKTSASAKSKPNNSKNSKHKTIDDSRDTYITMKTKGYNLCPECGTNMRSMNIGVSLLTVVFPFHH